MAQISQNPDGTYSRSYSDTELTLIRSLQDEIKSRQAGDNDLWATTTTITNRLTSLEQSQFSLTDIQASITNNSHRIDDHDTRIITLEHSAIVDSYSRTEMNPMLIPWKVEQLPHAFDVPTNVMFEKADLNDIRMGYMHFPHADINIPQGDHVPENTMQRFTIWAYVTVPKYVNFKINYADRCVLIVNDIVQQIYVDVGGNFGASPKIADVKLNQGWNRIQFLLSNETQSGGLVVVSNLYEQANYLTNLDYLSGLITGDRIQSGTLDERHFSPNMNLVVHTLHATATDVPGIIIGNAEEQGILQIADGTITKSKDEPFTFDQGIRVNGFIRVTQLLIDNDFIRAGDGMIVKTIKDEYGYTQMYEMINDLRLVEGGGLIVNGNGQEGYTIINDLQIRVNKEGGLSITGDPIRGYELTNTMALDGDQNGDGEDDGINVKGDPRHGYHLRNVMKLTSDYGIIKVTGDAWNGYSLKNTLQVLEGYGIKIDGSISEGKITLNAEVSDVVSDIDFVEITSNKEGVHRLAIPDYNKMIPWIQKGQAPWRMATPWPGLNNGWAVGINPDIPQFSSTSYTDGYVISGQFGGWIPAGTADCIRMRTWLGYWVSPSVSEIKVDIVIKDPDSPGGVWTKTFYRSTSEALDWKLNYNEIVHTIPIPVRDYWRHFDVGVSFRRGSGAGTANALAPEVWTDQLSANSPHVGNLQTVE